MTDATATQTQTQTRAPDPAERLLDAALPHVPFDGWSEATFQAARADAGIDAGLARALYPRGALDLALAYHRRGDAEMLRKLEQADLTALRFRDRIARAVRFRLEAAGDREFVRRGMTLFALPQNAGEGTKALWGTADAIWTALGDSSDDVNWYTKRMTLSGVYGSTVLYWLGDDSPGHAATWDFLDRRIDGVMQIEKVKADLKANRLTAALMAGPMAVLGTIRAPKRHGGMPGRTG
ncbi:COQ9 family protein [Pseudooceanicola sp.]|uniref:COQ9 family protein n=1 Tax=Pseudooceanicola sp. TaxID=1914328 RepID=UPI003511DEE7